MSSSAEENGTFMLIYVHKYFVYENTLLIKYINSNINVYFVSYQTTCKEEVVQLNILKICFKRI